MQRYGAEAPEIIKFEQGWSHSAESLEAFGLTTDETNQLKTHQREWGVVSRQ